MIDEQRAVILSFLTLTATCLTGGSTFADVDEPTPATQRSQTSPETLTYKLDRSHSSVAFRIKHFNVGYVYGLFRLGSGQFHLDPKNLTGSFVEAAVQADSINTNIENRDVHLKSADYFDVEKYTEISFKSSKVNYLGDNKFSVEGTLTLLGVTRPLTATVIDMGSTWMDHASAYQRGMTTTITVDRTKFGMKSEHYLSDEVEIFISLEGGASPSDKNSAQK